MGNFYLKASYLICHLTFIIRHLTFPLQSSGVVEERSVRL